MKIGHSVPGRLAGLPKEPRTGAKDTTEAPSAGASADTPQAVNLSDLSRTLSAMETKISDGSVDTQRVADIKAAIRNGDFKVDANAVADGLVKSVQDMLAKNA